MKKNTIIDNGNGTSTIIIDSPKHGVHHFLIDTQYTRLVEDYQWAVAKISKQTYAVTNIKNTSNKQKTMYLHNMLNGTPPGYVTDHISGNTLDNRLCNLRSVTHQENMFNQTRAKGYTWDKAAKKWRAHIKKDGKYYNLGRYNTEEEARAVYLRAKEELHKI